MNISRSGNPKIFIAERQVDIRYKVQLADNTTRTTCLQYFLRFAVDDSTEYLSNNVLWSLRRDYFYVTSRSSRVYDPQAQVFVRVLRSPFPSIVEESNIRALRAYRLHLGELSEQQICDSIVDVNGNNRLQYYSLRTQLQTGSITCETFIMVGVHFGITENVCYCNDCRQYH